MFYNPNIFYSLILGLIFFYSWIRINSKLWEKNYRIWIIVLLLTLSIPGILFDVYYLHYFDDMYWNIEFRSINNIEILNSFLGLTIWYIFAWNIKHSKLQHFIYLLFTILLITIPYAKPILMPLELGNKVDDRRSNNICMQSTQSTCGPCTIATILKYYNINKTERDVAQASFTSNSSTELWYLIRYVRNLWLKADIIYTDKAENLPTPSLVWTTVMSSYGHFISLLKNKDWIFTIWDSISGKKELSIKKFNKIYEFHWYGIHIYK